MFPSRRIKLDAPLTPLLKINLKSSEDLNVRPQTVKVLEENTEKMLLGVGLDDAFFGHDTKSIYRQQNQNQLVGPLVKLQSFCTVKKAVIKMKKQSTGQEENCKPHIW